MLFRKAASNEDEKRRENDETWHDDVTLMFRKKLNETSPLFVSEKLAIARRVSSQGVTQPRATKKEYLRKEAKSRGNDQRERSLVRKSLFNQRPRIETSKLRTTETKRVISSDEKGGGRKGEGSLDCLAIVFNISKELIVLKVDAGFGRDTNYIFESTMIEMEPRWKIVSTNCY